MVGRQGQRTGRGVGERAAVDGDDIGDAAVTEIRVGGELQFALGNRDRAAERVRGGKDDGSRSGLGEATRTGKDSGDRARTQTEVGGRRKGSGGASDGTRIQRDDTDRLGVGGEVQGAATDGDSSGVGQHPVAPKGEGATVDIGSTRIGISGGERELAVADLGQSRGGVGRGESGSKGNRGTRTAAADEIDLGDGAGNVGSWIGDDDTGDRTERGVDDRIALGWRTTGNHTCGTEADQRCADIAGAAVKCHVRLGDADTGGCTQRCVEADVEAGGIDGQSADEITSYTRVVNGTIEHRVDRGALDGRGQEAGEVVAGLERAAGTGEIEGGVAGGRQVRR